MKLLIATDYPENPDQIPGGVAAVAINLIDVLSREPHLDIHVLSRAIQQKKDRTVQKNNVSIHYFKSPTPKVMTRLVRDIPKVKRIMKGIGPDVVHAHLTDYVYPSLQLGFPTVWTPHGVTSHQVQGWGSFDGRIRGVIYGYLEQQSLARAKHIISISPFIQMSFQARTKARFYTIENPINDVFFNIVDGSVPGRILFVGSIHPRKGLDYLLEAFFLVHEQIPQASLHVVGPVLDSFFHAKIRKGVEAHNLENAISFLDICAQDRLAAEYRDAQVVALPSRVDTAPTAISEAMAASRPVVATHVGGIPWMIKDGRTGFLVPPGDVHALIRQILILLNDASLREGIGKRGRKEAEKRFALKEVGRKTLEVYQKVLHEHS